MTQWAALVTIMVTFMVLLFSLSQLEERGFLLGITSVRSALEGTGGMSLLPLSSDPDTGEFRPYNMPRAQPEESGFMMQRNMDLLRGMLDGLGEPLQVTIEHRGLLVVMPEGVTFEPGSSEPTDEADDVLRKLGIVLRQAENPLVIEGHASAYETSSIGGELAALRLATLRAGAVYRYLRDVAGIPVGRMQMAGHLLDPQAGVVTKHPATRVFVWIAPEPERRQ